MTSDSGSHTQISHGDYSAVSGAHGHSTVNVYQAPLKPTDAVAPAPPPHFVGRNDFLQRVVVAITSSVSEQRVIAIQGMGGTGKTVTAQKIAAITANEFPGGIFWGELANSGGDIRLILRSWARICGYDLSGEPNVSIQSSLVRGLLAERQAAFGKLLVIVDDIRDEGINATVLLKKTVPENVPLIITTRDERVSLSLSADIYALQDLSTNEEDALELLRFHANNSVGLIDKSLRQANLLLKDIGYSPLAIELAGKQLSLLGRKPGYNVAILRKTLRQQSPAALELPGHSSLVTLVSTSYERLSQDAKLVFRHLGIFKSGIIDAADVTGIVKQDNDIIERLLDTLVPISLLAWGKSKNSFKLHPIIGQLAQEYLKKSGEYKTAAMNHADYYLVLCELNASENRESYEQLDSLIPEIVWAVQHAIKYSMHEYLIRFAHALYAESLYLEAQGYTHFAAHLLSHAIASSKQLGDLESENIHLGNLGLVYLELEEPDLAITKMNDSLALSKERGDKISEAEDIGNLGKAYQSIGKFNEAIKYYTKALDLSNELEDAHSKAIQLGNLGFTYHELGKVTKATSYYLQALEICKAIDDIRSEEAILSGLGNAFFSIGDFKRSKEYFESALEISEEMGDKGAIAKHLGNIGNILHEMNEAELATEYLERSLLIHRETGDLWFEDVLMESQ